MASQSSDIEILVHVAAPSRTADDASYRRLASSYLSFEPRTRDQVTTVKCSWEDSSSVESRLGRQDAVPLSQELLHQVFIPESQELSFRSVIDNRSSPLLRQAEFKSHEEAEGSSPLDSFCAPPSQISDSYPLPDPRILNVTPTRVLESCFKNLASSRPLPEPSSPKCRVSKARAPSADLRESIPSSIPIPDSQRSSPDETPEIVKVIPVTPLVPGAARKRREPVPDEQIDETVIDITHISSSAVSLTASTASSAAARAESAPPVPSSKRFKNTMNEPNSSHLLRSASDIGPVRNALPPGTSSQVVHDCAEALEIRPHSPPPGITDLQPSDLVSEKLAKLARDLSSRYRPKAMRDVDPFERGYWLLDCRAWTPETRLEAWIFLANYLRSGLAGWGVWCRRDAAGDWIRLYCWAHVAKHTYLLLYLASGRHMKATGAEWRDGDGEAVLEVPPAEKGR